MLKKKKGDSAAATAEVAKDETAKKHPKYTMAEVAKHNTKDDMWLVYEDGVYSVAKWLPHHPGGELTMIRFAGRDATDEMLAFHVDWVLNTKLPTFRIGTVLDPPVPSKLVLAFRAFGREMREKGYFDRDLTYFVIKFSCIFSLLAFSVYLVLNAHGSAFAYFVAALFLGAYFQQMAFIGHDCGHMCVMTDRVQDWQLGLLVGNFCTGISIGW